MSATFKLHLGDCIATMRTLPEASVDAIVTDPPYELGFMGKAWDASGIANNVAMWTEALRVLKPGGHLLAFSGSRTYHRMVCSIEDAGFEIRDQIMWVYGSGFPKSLDVSKAIDKINGREFEDRYELGRHIRERRKAAGLSRLEISARFGGSALCAHWEAQDRNNAMPPTPEHWAGLKDLLGCDSKFDALVDRVGAEREVVGLQRRGASVNTDFMSGDNDITAPATDAARQWQGWGTALKPAHEPIVVARKPLIGTVAANVLAHGTGALNIDGCRVDGGARPLLQNLGQSRANTETFGNGKNGSISLGETTLGRWPANLIHDGSDDVLAAFPQALGQMTKASTADTQRAGQNVYGAMARGSNGTEPRTDAGSAARFFYAAKASKADRNEGNVHPTVKPTDLMAYLVRLVTPPGGTVLDPFTGSGSTGKACMREGFDFIGCELSPEYLAIARARIEHEQLLAAQRAYEAMLRAA